MENGNCSFTENIFIRKTGGKDCISRGATHFIVKKNLELINHEILVILWDQLLHKGGKTKFTEIYFRPNLKHIWLSILTIYSINLLTQSECRKIRTRKTPNTNTFYAVNGLKFANELIHSVFCVKIVFSSSFFLLQKSFHLSSKNERNLLEKIFCKFLNP